MQQFSRRLFEVCVQVAGQEEGLVVLLGFGAQNPYGAYAVVVVEREVCPAEHVVGVFGYYCRAHFLASGELYAFYGERFVFGEQPHAVFPTFKVNCGRVEGAHSQVSGILPERVAVVAACAGAVNLLYCDDVGIYAFDNAGLFVVVVRFCVYGFAVVDVVGCYAQCVFFSVVVLGCAFERDGRRARNQCAAGEVMFYCSHEFKGIYL